MEPYLRSLNDKLHMLAAGEAIGLTAAEAAVYGVEYADTLSEPEQDSQEVEDYGE